LRDIIDNLTRQHKELVKVTMLFVQQLQSVGRGSSADAYKSLHALSGILRVHIAMEDRSFYPFLVAHRDRSLRQLAERFLGEREQIQERFDRYAARWSSIAAIDAAPAQFVDETRAILQVLGMRMMAEDREFHPAIKKHFEGGP
jgi:hemerythrin-like domain-containing protein